MLFVHKKATVFVVWKLQFAKINMKVSLNDSFDNFPSFNNYSMDFLYFDGVYFFMCISYNPITSIPAAVWSEPDAKLSFAKGFSIFYVGLFLSNHQRGSRKCLPNWIIHFYDVLWFFFFASFQHFQASGAVLNLEIRLRVRIF